MKRAIFQGGHAWEQANIPTIPRPDLPLLLDMTTIAPLRLTIDMPKSMQSVSLRAGSLVGRVSLAKELARGMGRGKVSLHASY